METFSNEPPTAADILIADIKKCLEDTKFYSDKAISHLEKTDSILEQIWLKRHIIIEKKENKTMLHIKKRKKMR
jgi:hypothetical protein